MNNDQISKLFKRIFIPEDGSFDDIKKRRLYLAEIPDFEEYLQEKRKIENNREKSNLIPCLVPTFQEPLLKPNQEKHQVRKYNLLKYLAKEKMELGHEGSAISLLKRGVDISNQVASANFRLSSSLIRKKMGGYHDEDKLQDAYIDVMKSVDYFDFRRGIKFSTYATWVIVRSMMRRWSTDKKYSDRFKLSEPEIFTRVESEDDFHEKVSQNNMDKSLIQNLLKYCSPSNSSPEDHQRRLYIISHRYGLGDVKERETLQVIADALGITKERVRQIEKSSLYNMSIHANGVLSKKVA